MGQAVAGRNQYAIVGGNALVNLKGLSLNKTADPISLDPDISSNRISQVAGFVSEDGTISCNFANASGEDFENLWDAIVNNTEVAMYLYPTGTGSGQIYLYGNAFVTSNNLNIPLLETVDIELSFVSSDSDGFTRKTLA